MINPTLPAYMYYLSCRIDYVSWDSWVISWDMSLISFIVDRNPAYRKKVRAR